jgi:hypothetical protein
LILRHATACSLFRFREINARNRKNALAAYAESVRTAKCAICSQSFRSSESVPLEFGQSLSATREAGGTQMAGKSSPLWRWMVSHPHTRGVHTRKVASSTSACNVRLSAIRRLALETADTSVMAPELAAGIPRANRAKRSGVRLGHWLTAE